MPDTLDELHLALHGTDAAHAARNHRLRALARDILATGADPASPTREVLVRLGDRWSPLLLGVLATGCYRHTELHRVVNLLSRLTPDTPISQRMLTLRLRVLERDGLVDRLVGEGKAPSVHYCLTPLGEGLMRQLGALLRWSAAQSASIRAAQRAFDARAAPSSATVRHRVR